MNRGVIRYILGRMLLIEAGLMLFPLGVGFIYREALKRSERF